MKLFIVAALVSIASAARLEHLERSYLPPDQGSSQTSQYGSQTAYRPQGSFGSQGGHGSHGSFGGAQGFGGSSFGSSFESNSLGAGRPSALSAGFPATSNQYLPPDHGPSGSNGQLTGSLTGFNARSQYQPQSQYPSQYGGSQLGRSQFGSAGSQFGSAGSQFGSASTQFGSAGPHHGSVGSQYGSAGSQYGSGSGQFPSVNSQFPSASRQYLAPKSSFDSIPQQAFDEQTGYHY